MKKNYFLYFLLLFISSNIVLSEEGIPDNIPQPNYVDSVRTALTSFSDGDTLEAIRILENIPLGDTLAPAITSEIISGYLSLKDYDKVIALADQAIKNFPNYEDKYNFYLNKGVAYIRSERLQEAKKHYEEMAKLYPKYYLMYYNTAVIQHGLEEYKESFQTLYKTMTLNPYYEGSHTYIGGVYLKEDQIAQAALAYLFSIIANPEDENALVALYLVMESLTNKVEDLEKKNLELAGTSKFERVNLLLKNYAAVNKSYKIPSKAKSGGMKQVHLLCTELSKVRLEDTEENLIWNKLYIPFFKKMMKEGKFEGFSYYILQPSKNPDHQKLVKKKKYYIEDFAKWSRKEIDKLFERKDEETGEKIESFYYSQEKGGGLFTTGQIKNNVTVGKWKLYRINGNLRAEGTYNDQGERDGLWIWYYDDGSIQEKLMYKNNVSDGKYEYFNREGSLIKDFNYKEGELDGARKYFYANGKPSSEENYEEGTSNGGVKLFYGNGAPKYVYQTVDGNLQDTLIQYYPNGALYKKELFKDDKLEGEAQYYYKNGQLSSSGAYKEGKEIGEWKFYHENGQLNTVKNYSEEGKLQGEYKQYYVNGVLADEAQYDEKGNLVGENKMYDINGKLNRIHVFKDDKIQSYRNYAPSGELRDEQDRGGKEIYFKAYHSNGNLEREGQYNIKGGSEGVWKYYDESGTLITKRTYEDGEQVEWDLDYYTNGQISRAMYYEKGLLNGFCEYYDNQGNVIKHGWYKDGYASGTWKHYYPDGKLEEKQYYVKGSLEGNSTIYYLNGNKLKEYWYDEGRVVSITYYDTLGNETEYHPISIGKYEFKSKFVMDGTPKSTFIYENRSLHKEYEGYYPDGTVKFKGKYIQGRRDGMYTSYLPNGMKSYEGNYVTGDADGEHKDYRWDGTLYEINFYDMGILQKSYDYYSNGTLMDSISYLEGVKHGPTYFYGPLGDLEHVRYYSNGEIIGYSYLGTDGKLVEMIPIKNETGEITSYHPNGNVSRKYTLLNGEFHKEYLKYLPSGKLYDKHSNEHGYYNGKSISYYANGNIKEESFYIHGDLHGEVKSYYEDGTLGRVNNYYYGEEHGDWKYYSKDGKLTHTLIYNSGTLVGSK